MILHPIRKKLTAIFLASMLAAMPVSTLLAAQGKDKWYEVEIIVFSSNDSSLQKSEKWAENPGTPQITNVMELFSASELLFEDVDQMQMYYVEPIEPNEKSLLPLAQRITGSDEYSLRIHRTWRQIASAKRSTIPVYLNDNLSTNLYQPLSSPDDELETFIEEISPEQLLLKALLAEESTLTQQIDSNPFFIHPLDPIVSFEETEGLPNSEAVELSPMGPPNHTIFGTLMFFKNRYLHLNIDFSYRAKPHEPKVKEIPLEQLFPMAGDTSDFSPTDALTNEPSGIISDQPHQLNEQAELLSNRAQLIRSVEVLSFASQEKTPYVGYRLKGSKRIRLNEIHYFDHPLYGAIVRVAPYEPPEPEDKTAEE